MKTTHKVLFIVLTGILFSCSSKPEMNTAYIQGTITVADSVDASGDYSGIGVLITYRDNAESKLDTLFNKTTNQSGKISGKIKFPNQGVYPVFFTRNNTQVAVSQFLLADNDTTVFSAELPSFGQTLEIESREQNAMDQFSRISRGFNRVAAYISAGAVEDTLVEPEVRKWSNLFWEVSENHPGTLAEDLAMTESVRLLEIIDKEFMMERIDLSLTRNEQMILTASNYGFNHISSSEGIQNGINYLDSLLQLATDEDIKINLKQRKVEAYYDSSFIDEAQKSLEDFEKSYKDNSRAMEWAKTIGYDLDYLAPGYRIPAFSFVTQAGDSVNASTLMGKPYILEITPVASRIYQSQYDRTVVLHQIYQNYDLEIYTIPLDKSEVTVDAFFEDRVKHWNVAEFGTFDIQRLIEKFNVTDVPTRILVDRQGNIVRKYVTTEFTDVIQGMNTIISQTKRES